MLKALGLLVESGIAYSALLVKIAFALLLMVAITIKMQVLVIVYGADPAASPDSHARMWFNQVIAYFTQGCLAPLMVSTTHDMSTPVPHNLETDLQAIFPTVVIVLVALKLSPIDNGGLSGVQADGAARLDSGSTSDTVVFHRSTILSSSTHDMEASLREIPVGELTPISSL